MARRRPRRTPFKAALAISVAALLLPASAAAADSLYWSAGTGSSDSTIEGAPLAGGGTVTTLYGPSGGLAILGIALDSAAGRIYFVDGGATVALRAAPLAGGGTVDQLYTSAQGAGTPGLALDPAAGRLYFHGGDSLRAAPAAGGGTVDTLYTVGIDDFPTGVAVDPGAGRVYWTNFTNSGADGILGAPLAGGGTVDTLYNEAQGAHNPVGVAVDPAGGRVYWANNGDDTIRSAPLAGGGTVDTLYDSSDGVDRPAGVAVDPAAGRIYWINIDGDTIRGAPLSGAGPVDTLYTDTPMGGSHFLAGLRTPVGTVVPAISGGGQLGQQLSCSQGSWAPDFVASFFYRAPQSFAYQWALGGVDIGGVTASTHTPTSAGDYRCRVTASNQAGGTAQASSATSVARATPTLSSQATASATVGQPIADQATVAGGFNATGAITFAAYGPGDATCSGTAAYTSDPVAVTGDGDYTSSPAFTPTQPGTYRWIASYSGDANNELAGGACNDAGESSAVAAQPKPKPSTRITRRPGHRRPAPVRVGNGHRAVFGFVDAVPGVSFFCKLDGRRFKPCASPRIYHRLRWGPHTFTVKSRDSDGQESTPRVARFFAGKPRPH